MSGAPGRILIVNALYPPRVLGGAERSVQFLAEALAAGGSRVTVVTTTPEEKASVEELNGVRVHALPVANLYWPFGAKGRHSTALFHALDICNFKMQARVGAVLDAVRPDLVHTNTLVGFSVAVWRAAHERGIPVIHTLRDFYLLCPNSKMFRAGQNCGAPCFTCALYNAPKRALSRLVSGVVGNSQFMLDAHLANGFFPRATLRTVIHNAYPLAGAPAAAAAEKSGPFRLGYLGRLDEYKGVGVLLDAVARLPAGQVEVLLAGQGEPAYEAALRRRHPGPHIRFLGFVKPEELFAQIDALAVPSLWHEPLPRTVFEAYAHGLPVLASNRGGLPELVDEGRTGWMFDPAQPAALPELLRRTTADKTTVRALRAACLEKARFFRPEVIAQNYRLAYEAVLEKADETGGCGSRQR